MRSMRTVTQRSHDEEQDGGPLLKENPLHGVRLPREKNPKRPVMSHDVYLRLLEVADQVHPLLTLALIGGEGTGRRSSAWCNLPGHELELQNGTQPSRAEAG